MPRLMSMFGWIVIRLIRIRQCNGKDGCPAYDEKGNILVTVHVNARPALFLIKIMTGLVKGVSWICHLGQ